MLLLSQEDGLDIDKLQIDIYSGESTIAHNTYRVPAEAQLPTTVAIVSNGKDRGTAIISVVGWHGATPIDRRDNIVAQIPTDRVVALRVVLSGTCSKYVMTRPGPDGPVAESACGQDQTCDPLLGKCVDANVDASSLPNYAEGDEGKPVSSGGASNGLPGLPQGGVGGVDRTPGEAGSSASGEGGENSAGEGGENTSGTGGTNTSGTGGTNTSGTGGTNASGTGGTNASGTGGTNASGTGGTNASGTGGTNASGTGGTNASGTGGTNASGTGGTNPSGGGPGTAGGSSQLCAPNCQPPTPVCLAGVCAQCQPNPTPTTCRNGFPQYCDQTGTFANVASGKCLSTETCESGTCVCNGLKCSGVCRDTDTDSANCGSCGHVCVVGSCSAGRCTVVPVASAVNKPTHIMVGGGWLYWIAQGEPNGKAYNMPLATSQVSAVVIQGPESRVACDSGFWSLWANDSFVYFASYNVCQKAHGTSANSGSVSGNMYGAAVSSSLGTLTGSGGNVFNINTYDGFLQSSDGSRYRISSASPVLTIAADGQNLYWLEGKQGAAFVYKHTAPALDNTAVVELAKNQSYSEGIAAYNGFVYWTAAPSAVAGAGSIMRVSTSGGTVTTVASGQTSPSGLAVDASGVYWTNRFANGSVMRVAHAGGTPVELAGAQNGAHGIALDATTVYWTNTEGGEVRMISK